ncbi:MAG: hypothetical protein NDF55_00025 [archaeon GB-1867-005]|nr:hypothetical protein [Candidatus Culexmicrobium cathedralense]
MKLNMKELWASTIIVFIIFALSSICSIPEENFIREIILLIGFIAGLWAVFRGSEAAVVGLKSAVIHIGQTEYTAGVISSLASNSPELVVAALMSFRGLNIGSKELIEVAALTVIIGAGFNVLLLGLLIVVISWKKGEVRFPYKAIAHESDLIRMAIVTCLLLFAYAVIMSGEGSYPRELGIFMLATYASYVFFLTKSQKIKAKAKPNLTKRATMLYLALGFAAIIFGGELIVRSVEYVIHVAHINIVTTAIIIGCIGSIPEHGVALIGAHKGFVELGLANLLGGITQYILVIFGIMMILVPLPIDGYIMFQLISIASSLWIVKKAIIDDQKLTLDEGVFILILQVMLFIMLEELRM